MVFPVVQLIRFDIDVDPSGFRNIPASGQILGTAIDNCLDFGNVNTTTSGGISDTKMVIARVDSLGDASGVYNLRFFLANATAFNTGNYRFLHKIATHYQGPGFALGLSDADIPISEPSQNLLATNEQPVLSGITDADVSQYIYLALFVDSDVPFGTYGSCGGGTLLYRLKYDFS